MTVIVLGPAPPYGQLRIGSVRPFGQIGITWSK